MPSSQIFHVAVRDVPLILSNSFWSKAELTLKAMVHLQYWVFNRDNSFCSGPRADISNSIAALVVSRGAEALYAVR